MSDTKTHYRPASWSCPTDEDNRQWGALTRDEQVSALQNHFASSGCTTATGTTVDEIVARVRAERAAKPTAHADKL